VPLKANVDEALKQCPSVDTVVVLRRTGADVPMVEGRDIDWAQAVAAQSTDCPPEEMGAEDPLFILYTSGSTGKPKGVLHTTGGYAVWVSMTHQYVFDYRPGQIYWCAADIGWVTGHTYGVYGPLSNGVTEVLYEGTPDSPTQHRHFEIIEKYGVTIYYTAPTLVRTFMKWGREIADAHDLSSLRLLGTVGEPINPEAWRWYRTVIGADRLPIVDTWWQTETGAAMISPLPGVAAAKPGSAMRALPGISASIVDDHGDHLTPTVHHGEHVTGYLVLDQPWPSMLRGIWGDPERYVETYWSRFAEQGWYFAGDSAYYDRDGAIWVVGRIDDVMNVSGHRLSTTEIESALVSHPWVAEAAVVGANDPTTGQAIVAFVILRGEAAVGDQVDVAAELRNHVAREIGPIAKPRQILVVPELPKTRSGKIMRRLLRDVAEHRDLGDVTTLQDSSVMELISSGLRTTAATDD
jgi:acetyl-CoA synthetase